MGTGDFVRAKTSISYPRNIYIFQTVFTGSQNPKDALFDFENKIIAGCLNVYNTLRSCAHPDIIISHSVVLMVASAIVSRSQYRTEGRTGAM